MNHIKRHCITQTCGAENLVRRGLCEQCYRELDELVQNGEATWAELAKCNMALPELPPFSLKDVARERIRDLRDGRKPDLDLPPFLKDSGYRATAYHKPLHQESVPPLREPLA